MEYKLLKQKGALQEGFDSEAPTRSKVRRRAVPVQEANVGRQEKLKGVHPSVNLLPEPPDGVRGMLPESIARENVVFPLGFDGETLLVASSTPNDIALADKLRFVIARNVSLVPADRQAIMRSIEKYYGAASTLSADSMLAEFTETAIDFTESVDGSESDLDDDCFGEYEQSASFGTRMKSTRRNAKRATARPGRVAVSASARAYDGSSTNPNVRQGMFFYTVDDGQQVLMKHKDGRSEILVGPKRVSGLGKRFQPLEQFVAHPGEFLIVRYRDGRQEHLVGPSEIWFDPRVHDTIKREDALQIAANEAVVVYTEAADSKKATRRIEHGPQLFAPKPGEWLHTFSWHASAGGSKGAQKQPQGLVFQKLWLMPDQMYHDVRDVRTADDAVLTVRLMIFYELKDINKMLDTTHDPIGDFVNAATADVVGFTSRHDFDQFKQHTSELNDLATYTQLLNRAEQSGYQINNVVFRGYGAPDSLQRMQDEAIEARTKLQLQRDTEQQEQQLEDYKLESQLSRSSKRRSEQADEIRHDLALNKEKQQAVLEHREKQKRSDNEQRRQAAEVQHAIQREKHSIEQSHYQALSEMGVDLTAYLTQARADQVIELRGDGSQPHVHLQDNANQRRQSNT
ncbi:MAG: hypothetical protein AB8G99_15110 [Planctomycetaceae bacterium]